MAQRLPANPGDPLESIDTPALVIDLDAFERNLDAMARGVTERGMRLRPHAKAHKCPEIAIAQIALGAVGICCQKTDEAEAFVARGVHDVLVTNEVVLPAKLARLASLARTARIGVLADDPSNVADLGAAAAEEGVKLDVYVEVDVGAHRCGVSPGETAALAQTVAATAGLEFAGLHCYQGAAQHLRAPEERQAAIAQARALALASKEALNRAGLPVPIVTGSGTGTWALERDSGVWNELQPGSYVFMDADYGRNVPAHGEMRFSQSLFVLASVMSVAGRDRAICDAGLKAFSFDSGVPLVHAHPGLEYTRASDEHGVLAVAPSARAPQLRERIWLIPGHCDPTVNLYDHLVGVRGDVVECVWPIAARGALG